MGLLSRLVGCLTPTFGVEEHYKLIKCLGVGGEGEVWLAKPRHAAGGPPRRRLSAPSATPAAPDDASEDAADGTGLVALKFVRRGLSRWQVEAVAAEVQCLLELGEGHVNIITPTELLLSPTHLGLVTHYAPGGSLAAYVARQRGGRLPEREAAYFFRQVVAALQFCHARCIGA